MKITDFNIGDEIKSTNISDNVLRNNFISNIKLIKHGSLRMYNNKLIVLGYDNNSLVCSYIDNDNNKTILGFTDLSFEIIKRSVIEYEIY